MGKGFNVNNHVKVKLTDYGKKLLEHHHKEFWNLNRFPENIIKQFPYKHPDEDEQGYSKWQLWDLMSKLGKHLYNGCKLPFEPTILIEQ